MIKVDERSVDLNIDEGTKDSKPQRPARTERRSRKTERDDAYFYLRQDLFRVAKPIE